jgi:hypothetical protein
MWMRVDYAIEIDGSFSVRVAGSYVPSQIQYAVAPGGMNATMSRVHADGTRDEQRVIQDGTPLLLKHHDMLRNSLGEITATFESKEVRAVGNYARNFEGRVR